MAKLVFGRSLQSAGPHLAHRLTDVIPFKRDPAEGRTSGLQGTARRTP